MLANRIFKSEDINIFSMTYGYEINNKNKFQTFIFKKKLDHIVFGVPHILFPQPTKSFKPSLFGKNYENKVIKNNEFKANYIGFIDSAVSFNLNNNFFEYIFEKNYFPMWNPSEPIKFFKNHKNGYIIFLRIYIINKTFDHNLLNNYVKNKFHIYSFEFDPNQLKNSNNFEFIKPLIPDFEFNEIKNDIIKYLKENKLFLSENTNSSYQGIINFINPNDEIISAIHNEIKIIDNSLNLNQTEKDQLVKIRIGQSLFKKLLLNFQKKCKICGINDNRILNASHIKPWSKSNNKERTDYNNGFILCPQHDALFDKGFISFDKAGKINISKQIDESLYKLLNINKEIFISIVPENVEYLEWHFDNIFLK